MGRPATPIKYEWFDALLAAPASNELGIDAYTIAVAAAIRSHMNERGECWPSVRRLVDESKCSLNTVQDRIAGLEKVGALGVKRRPRRANLYTAQIAPWMGGEITSHRRREGSPSVSPGDTDGEGNLYHQSGNLYHRATQSVSPGDTESSNPGTPVEGKRMSARGGGSASATPRPAHQEQEVKECINAIASRANVALDGQILGQPIAAALTRTGWRPPTLAIYAVEKLKAEGKRVRRPANYLATDLRNVNADYALSPRMRYSETLAELYDLDERLDLWCPRERKPEDADTGVAALEEEFEQHLWIQPDTGLGDAWCINDRHIADVVARAGVELQRLRRVVDYCSEPDHTVGPICSSCGTGGYSGGACSNSECERCPF